MSDITQTLQIYNIIFSELNVFLKLEKGCLSTKNTISFPKNLKIDEPLDLKQVLKDSGFMKIAGLIFDSSVHYLDHIAPFCSMQKCPLIICEPEIAELAQIYYPKLSVIEKRLSNLKLPENLVSCHPRPALLAAFPFPNIKTCWLPHGNSDKGWKSVLFESLRHEETALVYGQKMIDCIEEKNGKLLNVTIKAVGNFRKTYAENHALFYKSLLQKKFSLPQTKRTLLYAPTWKDAEDNSSFWQAFPILANTLPEDYTLLVKPHPNTWHAFAPELERLIGTYQMKKNIVWIFDFPPIYPLLELCNGYIGDMSSIGYDFLSKNRPMYFLNTHHRDAKTDKGLYLYQCGQEFLPSQYENLFTIDRATYLEDAAKFTAIRKTVYNYTFSEKDF